MHVAAKAKQKKTEPTSISVGDQVRVPLEVDNAYAGYQMPVEQKRAMEEPVEGLVCSIRHVPTGKLVKTASGAMDEYVFEILHSRSFNPRFSSDYNVGKSKVPRLVQEYETWSAVRTALRELAAKGELLSDARGELAKQALAPNLDGWRVVKMRSSVIESLEEEVSGPQVRAVPEIEEPVEREFIEEPERRI
jgi:hypothetical protein